MPNLVNPIQLINMIKSGQNPQQMLMSIMENQIGSTPMGANLLSLMRSNNTTEIERVARNICAQKGLDFDKEFTAFRQKFGL